MLQVLNSARNKIDAYASEISDFKILVRRAQKYLLARGTYPFSGDARNRNSIQDRPMPVPKGRLIPVSVVVIITFTRSTTNGTLPLKLIYLFFVIKLFHSISPGLTRA